MLPDTIKAALNYLLPALFGALLVQFGMKMKKHSVIMVVFAIILYFMIGMGYFNWLPGTSNWLGTLGCVFVSIAAVSYTHLLVSKKLIYGNTRFVIRKYFSKYKDKSFISGTYEFTQSQGMDDIMGILCGDHVSEEIIQ